MKEKISEPSASIEKILTLVRMLPVDTELIDSKVLSETMVGEDSKGRISRIREAFKVKEGSWDLRDQLDEKKKLFDLEIKSARVLYDRESLIECLRYLPTEFVDYVGVNSSLESNLKWIDEFLGISIEEAGLTSESSILASPDMKDQIITFVAIQRYDQAREVYDRAYELLAYLEAYRELPELILMFRKKPNFFSFTGVKVLENKLRSMPDEFTDAFNGLDIDRLGRCGYCRRIFWKSRKDMKGCTLLCAKRLRTRKWREKMTPEKRLEYKISRVRKSVLKGE